MAVVGSRVDRFADDRGGHQSAVKATGSCPEPSRLLAAWDAAWSPCLRSKVTTIGGGHAWRRPDLIDRDVTAQAPGERLVGDITYLRTGVGSLYMATVIDQSALTYSLVGGWFVHVIP